MTPIGYPLVFSSCTLFRSSSHLLSCRRVKNKKKDDKATYTQSNEDYVCLKEVFTPALKDFNIQGHQENRVNKGDRSEEKKDETIYLYFTVITGLFGHKDGIAITTMVSLED